MVRWHAFLNRAYAVNEYADEIGAFISSMSAQDGAYIFPAQLEHGHADCAMLWSRDRSPESAAGDGVHAPRRSLHNAAKG